MQSAQITSVCRSTVLSYIHCHKSLLASPHLASGRLLVRYELSLQFPGKKIYTHTRRLREVGLRASRTYQPTPQRRFYHRLLARSNIGSKPALYFIGADLFASRHASSCPFNTHCTAASPSRLCTWIISCAKNTNSDELGGARLSL